MNKSREYTENKCKEILEYFDNYVEKNGFSPTFREISTAMNFSSSATAYKYIERLIKLGEIERTGYGSRSLRRKREGEYIYRVPVLGIVTAGTPITAIENPEGFISFVSDHKYSDELFALHVRGESMINIGIYDGDLIIAKKQPSAENGDIVVAMTDENEATVKRFFREKDHIRLQPENDTMEPIILSSVTILGKVIGLQRTF